MLQSDVFFKDYSHYPRSRKRAWIAKVIIIQKIANLLLLAEVEGVAATSLGQRPSRSGIIHRVPSGEGVTATSLGNFKVIKDYIKINRKKAPDGLCPISSSKPKRRVHGA